MNIRPRFLLTCLIFTAAILAIGVVGLYLDSSVSVKMVLSLFILLAMTIVWFSVNKKAKISSMSGESEWKGIQSALQDFEQTRIYVLKLDTQSSSHFIYKQDDIIYIRLSNPVHLCGIASRLFEYHAGQTVALGVELSVYSTSTASVGAYLKDCLRNLLFLQKHLNFIVPVSLVIHAPKNLFHPQSVSKPGFILKHQVGQQESNVVKFLEGFQDVLAYFFLSKPSQTSSHYHHYFLASQVVSSVKDIFLEQVDSGWSYVDIRNAALIADTETQPYSLWQQFVHKATGGLVWPQSEKVDYVDVSIFSSNSSDVYYRKNILLDWACKLLLIATIAFLAAISCSTVNNYSFLKKISTHIAFLEKSASQSSFAYRQAKEELRYDLETLKAYQRNGEPTRLGLGLYHAEILIPKIEHLLNQSDVSEPNNKPQPVVLTLDSLALFETGQYELKQNANKSLIGILKAIEQYPDTQIMVEGHTDNIGNQISNQQLSEKRALAVRDWLVVSSSLPAARFAVKGYGDTRPVAENTTEEGRAKNRRVEIILIPNIIFTEK